MKLGYLSATMTHQQISLQRSPQSVIYIKMDFCFDIARNKKCDMLSDTNTECFMHERVVKCDITITEKGTL